MLRTQYAPRANLLPNLWIHAPILPNRRPRRRRRRIVVAKAGDGGRRVAALGAPEQRLLLGLPRTEQEERRGDEAGAEGEGAQEAEG